MGQPFLIGERTYLRAFEESDITEEWLNDPEITRYLGTKKYEPTVSSVKTWLERHHDNTTNLAFAIIDKATDSNVGTISLDNIRWVHRTAEFHMMLNPKSFLVQDCGEEAMSLTIDYAFQRMGLRKLLHSADTDEAEKIHMIEKLGFQSEVLHLQQIFMDGEYHDLVIHGLFSHEFKQFCR